MITLERFAYSPLGTFGKLTYKDFTCYTVERPWLNNTVRESCIPEGAYTLVWFDSPKFGRVVAFNGGTVTPYPDAHSVRSAVLIHPANVMSDVEGCIGLGDTLGYVKSLWGVLNSQVTTKAFYALLSKTDNNFPITITQVKGALV